MSTTKRIPWIAAAIFLALLTATLGAAQKSLSPEALYQRAYQKETVDGDTKAAIDLYKQVAAAPGASQKLKALAQDQMTKLTDTLAGSLTDRLICSDDDCPGPRALAATSADGRYLAFTNGSEALEIRDMVTGRVTRPTEAKDLNYAPWPLLSPDGQQVVYASTEHDGNGRVIKQSLRVVPSEANGKPRTLVDSSEFKEFIPGAWARSNKDVLVALSKPDETWQLAWISIADRTVKPIKFLGWRFNPLSRRPSLSPDGRYIAYSALANAPSSSVLGNSPSARDSHIYVLPVDGTTPEIELVKGASINEAPVWMPDSKSVLFVSDRGGPWGLWSAALKDGKEASPPVLVKAETGRITTVGATNSGSYYYEMQQTQVARFSIAGLNGSKSQDLNRSTSDPIIGVSPVWSPDGKHVAFTRQTLSQSGQLVNTLFVYSLDSAEERRYAASLNSTLNPVGKPLWFHNGKSLIQLMRDAKGETSLFRVDLSRIDLKGAEFKQVATNIDSAPLAISSDDKTIYILIRGQSPFADVPRMDRIVAMDINSGQLRDVSTVSEPDNIILSHDDKTLYMASCGNRKCDRIVAVDAATGQQRQLLKLQDPEWLYGPRLALSPDGQMLAGVSGTFAKSQFIPMSFQLFQIGVDGNGYRKLADMNSLPGVDGNGDRTFANFKDLTSQPGTLSWSNDGTIAAHLGSVFILISPNGGKPEVIKSKLSSDENVSPDGSHLVVATKTEVITVLRALDNVASFLKTAQ